MPSVKQGGGYTLTFAKKNEDVRDLLSEKKKNKGFVLTDYICEAIRFFEANRDKCVPQNQVNIDIEHLVKQEIAKALGNTQSQSTYERYEDKFENEESPDLEDNLQDVDIDDD